MSRTESTMLALGTPAPDFSLPDVAHDRLVTLAELSGARPLLMMFISRHCPFVMHVAHELAKIDREYGDRVEMVGISSNDVESYPEDAPDHMASMARGFGYRFPVLYDGAQDVARACGAACTPDFFLFDTAGHLVYRGQLDGSRPNNDVPVTGSDLRAALDAVLAGASVSAEQRPSMGCNIKWKPGKAPAYFAGRPGSA